MITNIIKVINRIYSLCKDRHAYLREACAYTCSNTEIIKENDTLANLLFYPLQIACNIIQDQQIFLPLSLEGILCLLRLSIITDKVKYILVEVPIPIKKKGIFSTTDITLPSPNNSYFNENSKTDSPLLIDLIINILKKYKNSYINGISLFVVKCFVECIKNYEWISGERLLECFKTALEAQLEVKPFTGSGISNTLLPQLLTIILKRNEKFKKKLISDLKSSDNNIINSSEKIITDDNSESNILPSEDLNNSILKNSKELKEEELLSIYELDCYNILLLICNISLKEFDISSPSDSLDWRSKRLTCVLISHFLSEMNTQFAYSNLFQSVLHNKLTVCILINCTLDDLELYRLSLKILYFLVINYRNILKSKIIIFILSIFIPILESKTTSYMQKSKILKFFQLILREPKILIDWFTNFDCIQSMPNFCEIFISHLSKLAKMSHNSQWISIREDNNLRLECIKALCIYVQSLEIISRDFQPLNNSNNNNNNNNNNDNKFNENEKFNNIENQENEQDKFSKSTLNSSNFFLDSGIEQLLREKKKFDTLVEKFNNGDHMIALNIALKYNILPSLSPEDIAVFLQNKELDPISVGEFLGKNTEERKTILRSFISLNDFTGLVIDEAMRLFLSKFKLPGEAQIVDRAMEIFAEQYCIQNPLIFSGPSPAFILAFSIMILNTDAHSAHINEKMTLQQFIKNNKGIDDGKDLSQSLLEEIYQRITLNEIKLENRGVARNLGSYNKKLLLNKNKNKSLSLSSSSSSLTRKQKQRQSSRQLEKEYLLEASLDQITQDVTNETFHSINSPEFAGAMLESTWTALLSAFSIPMEEINNIELIDICLEGFEYSIKVCCRFLCRMERKAFISGILAFTHLTNFREIEYKSLKSIVIIIRIALEAGDYLESSWYEILRCISLLYKLQILADASPISTTTTNTNTNSSFTKSNNNNINNNSFVNDGNSSSLPTQSHKDRVKLERQNAEIISKYIDEVEVHRLFSRSDSLKDSAVIYLIEALCLVSTEELNETPPRLFSLQKLVEVTDINIKRLRYVWSKMWSNVASHLIKVVLKSNHLVSMFVVDHLRQLATKFISREKLGNFNFQKDVLRPFEIIALQTKSLDIKELILASLGQMVESQADNICSGWSSLLVTIRYCINSNNNTNNKEEVKFETIYHAAIVLQRISLFHLHLLSYLDVLELINSWVTIARSMKGDKTLDSTVWYIQYVTYAFVNLILLLEKENIEENTMNLIHVLNNEKEKNSLLSREEIQHLTMMLSENLLNKDLKNIELNNGKKIKDLCFLSISLLTSLISVESISNDTMDVLFKTIYNLRNILNYDIWCYMINITLSSIIDFLINRYILFKKSSNIWLDLLKQFVKRVIELVENIFINEKILPVNQILFLIRIIIDGMCRGCDDSISEISFQGGRKILVIFEKYAAKNEFIWNEIVIYINEVGNNLMKSFLFFCRYPKLEEKDSKNPVIISLFSLLQYIKWIRDAALVNNLTISSRIKLILTLNNILNQTMTLISGLKYYSLCTFGDNNNFTFILALFISLERSLCNAIIEIDQQYGETIKEEINIFRNLVLKQFITISNGISEANKEEKINLKEVIRQMLYALLQASSNEMILRVKSCMPLLCKLISVNEESLASLLGALFLKYYKDTICSF